MQCRNGKWMHYLSAVVDKNSCIYVKVHQPCISMRVLVASGAIFRLSVAEDFAHVPTSETFFRLPRSLPGISFCVIAIGISHFPMTTYVIP